MSKVVIQKVMGTKDAPTPIPICPKCGREAMVAQTKYGPRAECCGLWSWNMKPLADAKTHEARRALVSLIGEARRTFGPEIHDLVRKRTNIPFASPVSEWNEVTTLRYIRGIEDVIMDMMAGDQEVLRYAEKWRQILQARARVEQSKNARADTTQAGK